MTFAHSYTQIIKQLERFNPLTYAKTRNFKNGALSYLSPYISRGVISTRLVFEHLKEKNYPFAKIEKYVQELAWRDYWQQIWVSKGETINEDFKNKQSDVLHDQIPVAILQGETGIEEVDKAIRQLKETGYMHNHMRMYLAALACNNGKSHWNLPAKWMYYYLLDADWASNSLSWQWVAGTNSNKKYIANQENINKYFSSTQEGTFLDKGYEEIAAMPCPSVLEQTAVPSFEINLPKPNSFELDHSQVTLLYNEYNLDPLWRAKEKANRILLLDPNRLREYPMSKQSIDFILKLGNNIPGLQIFIGDFDNLQASLSPNEVYFKEHPLNVNYKGVPDDRDWLCSVKGYYPSFFTFWKKCKKEIQY